MSPRSRVAIAQYDHYEDEGDSSSFMVRVPVEETPERVAELVELHRMVPLTMATGVSFIHRDYIVEVEEYVAKS